MTVTLLQGVEDVEIHHIVYDSKKTKLGSLFICIEGADHDGHDFAQDTVEKGAVVIVCSKPLFLKENVTVLQVEDCRKAMAILSAAFYGWPAKQLTMIGITGTKGKTSTAYMMREMLRAGGIKTGLIGTVEVDLGNRTLHSSQTTPESLDLQAYLREMVDAGCKVAVMEVSSQALKMHRVYGVYYDFGVMTNLEVDHIGPQEHADFEEYLHSKSKLFSQCETAVVNRDCAYTNRLLRHHRCKRVLTYGFSPESDLYAEKLDYVRLKDKFAVEFQTKGRYNINLVVGAAGAFSAYNAMAAGLTTKTIGISDDAVRKGARTFFAPGRQEVIPLFFDRVAIVDYAHNGMALAGLLQALRQYQPSRITCVFGCGGQRDPRRRAEMGEAAAKYADFSIITSDNPRNESPTSIISDIIDKIKALDGDYCVIEDRRAAIAYAVEQSRPREIVVIAGKGHEQEQIIGNCRIHFDDREEVRASMEKVKHEQNNNRRNQKRNGR